MTASAEMTQRMTLHALETEAVDPKLLKDRDVYFEVVGLLDSWDRDDGTITISTPMGELVNVTRRGHTHMLCLAHRRGVHAQRSTIHKACPQIAAEYLIVGRHWRRLTRLLGRSELAMAWVERITELPESTGAVAARAICAAIRARNEAFEALGEIRRMRLANGQRQETD